jgi:2-dehydro-3-deoxyphosphogluconate aldolase/(4S)-4-hydroxy-2-oxoglutarate aldolase
MTRIERANKDEITGRCRDMNWVFSMTHVLDRIAQLKLIPMVVLDHADHTAPFAEALVRGGLPVAEITFRTAAAEQAIRTLAQRRDLLVGAGTVLTTEQADRAIGAGAQFIVAPGTNPTVVEHVRKQGVMMCPGVVTPTDIELAMSLGVTTLKFFPAETMGGVAMLKALAGPYPDVRFIPTGGITPELLPNYLKLRSVVACGGSWLAPRHLLAEGKFDAIQRLVEQAVKLLAEPPEIAT